MCTPTFALLACDVFQEELKVLGGESPPWASLRYLEMGLHDQPDRLRAAVADTLQDMEKDLSIDTIALAYGRCGNGLIGVQAQRCTLILPQAHDCISVLLGGRAAHDAVLKGNPGTYFYSPGWVRGKRVPGPDRAAWLRKTYAQQYEDDEEMIEELIEADAEAFAHHNRAAYVSIIDHPESAAYTATCAQHLNWEHKTLEGRPGFLKALIQADWDSPRFLKVPPGHMIGADADGNLEARAPV